MGAKHSHASTSILDSPLDADFLIAVANEKQRRSGGAGGRRQVAPAAAYNYDQVGEGVLQKQLLAHLRREDHHDNRHVVVGGAKKKTASAVRTGGVGADASMRSQEQARRAMISSSRSVEKEVGGGNANDVSNSHPNDHGDDADDDLRHSVHELDYVVRQRGKATAAQKKSKRKHRNAATTSAATVSAQLKTNRGQQRKAASSSSSSTPAATGKVPQKAVSSRRGGGPHNHQKRGRSSSEEQQQQQHPDHHQSSKLHDSIKRLQYSTRCRHHLEPLGVGEDDHEGDSRDAGQPPFMGTVTDKDILAYLMKSNKVQDGIASILEDTSVVNKQGRLLEVLLTAATEQAKTNYRHNDENRGSLASSSSSPPCEWVESRHPRELDNHHHYRSQSQSQAEEDDDASNFVSELSFASNELTTAGGF
eukprot:CAMPEP_0119559652 /NCGR_PEP_ID=MMETSP1352-20130426/13011_1 /TAXON_ID=265584 /ORGANISM="Stauroneis constricta, Strain CCMP1120" /LENGTH=419 /DNA_ID=CAMNT_0007607413 /DNA_START=93 /DNA_END=1352 /DNA_ORIENTATION=+